MFFYPVALHLWMPDDGSMATPWQGISKTEYPQFTADLDVDVLIVGGGLTGIHCAYLLADKGLSIVVLESDTLGSWATIDTTAFITQILDTNTQELIEIFGAEQTRLVLEAGSSAIDEIERIVQKEKIDCEFERCSAYIYANNFSEFQELEEEDQAFDKLDIEHDFKRDEKLSCSDFGFLEVPHQAKFFPTKYLYQLADIASKRGVKIFENSEALRVVSDDPIVVETKQAKVTAKKLIVATYFPFNNPKITHYKKGMYRSYAFEVRLPKGQLLPGLYWDKANPYHYFRIDTQNSHDRMIIGGEDHRDEIKMDRDKNFNALEDYLKKIVPSKYEIVKKWSGPILEPSDGLALIGEYMKDQFVATAFSGNGMTYSMVAGLLIRDQILGQPNPWSEVFDPKRALTAKALLKKGEDYTQEFLGSALKNLFR